MLCLFGSQPIRVQPNFSLFHLFLFVLGGFSLDRLLLLGWLRLELPLRSKHPISLDEVRYIRVLCLIFKSIGRRLLFKFVGLSYKIIFGHRTLIQLELGACKW